MKTRDKFYVVWEEWVDNGCGPGGSPCGSWEENYRAFNTVIAAAAHIKTLKASRDCRGIVGPLAQVKPTLTPTTTVGDIL